MKKSDRSWIRCKLKGKSRRKQRSTKMLSLAIWNCFKRATQSRAITTTKIANGKQSCRKRANTISKTKTRPFQVPTSNPLRILAVSLLIWYKQQTSNYPQTFPIIGSKVTWNPQWARWKKQPNSITPNDQSKIAASNQPLFKAWDKVMKSLRMIWWKEVEN